MASRLVSLVLLLLSAAPAFAGPGARFGDWTVSCGNGLDCYASTSVEAEEGIVGFGLSRGPRAGNPPKMTLGLLGEGGLSGEVVFEVARERPVSVLSGAFEAESGAAATRDGALAAELLPKMRAGEALVVRATLGGRPVERRFSLKGLTAALFFLDEAQMREETPGALAAKGTRPAPDPASFPAEIAAVADVPEALRGVWLADPACAPEGPLGLADLADLGSVGFSAPVAGATLYGLTCGRPGAYNTATRFYRLSGFGIEPLALPEMAETGPRAAETALNVDWDQRRKELTAFAKGRGVGDCGTYARYAYDEAAGGGFLLKEFRAKPDCDGEEAGGPANWPKLWPRD